MTTSTVINLMESRQPSFWTPAATGEADGECGIEGPAIDAGLASRNDFLQCGRDNHFGTLSDSAADVTTEHAAQR